MLCNFISARGIRSWPNCPLILSQMPMAIQVAGYRTWQSPGRQVGKPPHICSPCRATSSSIQSSTRTSPCPAATAAVCSVCIDPEASSWKNRSSEGSLVSDRRLYQRRIQTDAAATQPYPRSYQQ
jgi:hypothetical protein